MAIMTAKEMIPAVGQDVYVIFEEIRVACTVRDVKHVWGRVRLLVEPVGGLGKQWVEMQRVGIVQNQTMEVVRR